MSENRFLQLLEKKTLLVGDGGMGTMLQQAGLSQGTCGELWNMDQPETVTEIQRRYVDAGSDFIITNTFGGSPPKLKAYGLDGRTEKLNEAGARVAKAAAGDSCLVLGDVGPTGEILEPYGTVSPDTLRNEFIRQVNGLVQGGADAIIIETMMDLNELRCACEAVLEVCDLPVITSMCFKEAGDSYRSMFGQSAAEAAKEMQAMGACVAASNCMVSFDEYVPIVQQMREGTDLPIMAQPNAGNPRVENGSTIYDQTPEEMLQKIPAIVKAGARIVGGCCGTNPEYIRLLREWIDGQ